MSKHPDQETTSDCPVRDQLFAFIVGDLPAERREAIARHIERCARCLDVLRTLDDNADSVIAAARKPLPPELFSGAAGQSAPLSISTIDATYYSDPGDGPALHTPEGAGPTLGAYELLEPVRPWRGGMVYSARHSRLRRTVLIQVLEGEHATDSAARSAFAQSAQTLAQLTHPNLAGVVLEVCLEGPTPYLVLESSPGTPLTGLGPRNWLARQCEGLYPNRRVAQAMLDAARGLAAVHQAGLSHGNLRPEVIRLDPSGVVLLAGLGEDEAAVAEAVPFAPPPGAAAGDARRRDLFALGASFYFLVTGTRPVTPDSPSAKRLNPGVSHELSDILACCLAADPNRGYTIADILIGDLECVLATETVRVPQGSRGLFLVEAMVALCFAGLPLGVLVALSGLGYEEDPASVILLGLGSSALLYWLGTEIFWGKTLLRCWRDFKVADLAGDPAPRARRLAWTALLLLVEGMVALCLAGLPLGVHVASAGFGYEVSPGFIILLWLGSPALLYWLGTEVFLGVTLLRRWQGFEVVDLSGDRAPRPRGLARTALKIALFIGFCIGFVSASIDAVDLGEGAIIPAVIFWLFPFVAIMLGPSLVLLDYRLIVLGEPLTPDDVLEAKLPLHDRITGTRLVVRRPAAPRPAPVPTASAADTLGGPATDRIGPYDLGPRLGEGGMGAVYRAWDRTLGRPVAIKLLGERLLDQPLAQKRFEREARLLAQLNHPNVGKVYGVGQWNENLYIALELIDGETLQQRVRRHGPLPVSEAWRYLLQAAEALQAADRLGIVHRDVKPSNLMVTPQGALKLTDFGVSRRVEGEVCLTRTGTVVGTPLYMAPEQATGQRVDRRADMYSLGMTLYYLLAGRPAFMGANPMDLLAQQLASAPPSLAGRVPGWTDAQDAILTRLLAPRKEDRFADYDTLLDALRTESPDHAPAAPIFFRCLDGLTHLACCTLLLIYTLLLARSGLPAVLPKSWTAGLVGLTLWSPGLLLTWQLLATLLTVLVVVHRPARPFHPQGTRSVRDLGRIAGNYLYWLLMACLGFWPLNQHTNGMRVTERRGRRLGLARAALRFAVTYPLMLPWAWIGYLPGLSVEGVAWPLVWGNLGLLAFSGLILLRHPERRHLGDLIAGTRVVRVTPRMRVMKMPKPDRLVLFAFTTVLILCPFVGPWVGCQLWLRSLRTEHEAKQGALEHVHLLRREAVQKELKLSEDQIKKVEEFKKVQEKLGEAIKLGGKDLHNRMQELENKEKAVAAILKPEQVKRLKQISWQKQRARAFTDPEVAKVPQLTDIQKKEIQEIIKDRVKQMSQLFETRDVPSEETDKKVTALLATSHDKIMKLLTDEQKTRWKELQGEPFNVRSAPD